MNHRRTFTVGILLVFCAISVCTTMAEERDAPVDKPLILEFQLQSGSALRQEILVSEGSLFRVATRTDKTRWVVEGNVERIADCVAVVTLKVGVYGPGGYSILQSPMKLELNVDEFKGGGGGTRHLVISDVWIRRGVDAIRILIEQLSAEPDRSAAAADYLGELGAEAKRAIPALEKVANGGNHQVKEAARRALHRIKESVRTNVN